LGFRVFWDCGRSSGDRVNVRIHPLDIANRVVCTPSEAMRTGGVVVILARDAYQFADYDGVVHV
jgi:hypothetical protein